MENTDLHMSNSLVEISTPLEHDIEIIVHQLKELFNLDFHTEEEQPLSGTILNNVHWKSTIAELYPEAVKLKEIFKLQLRSNIEGNNDSILTNGKGVTLQNVSLLSTYNHFLGQILTYANIHSSLSLGDEHIIPDSANCQSTVINSAEERVSEAPFEYSFFLDPISFNSSGLNFLHSANDTSNLEERTRSSRHRRDKDSSSKNTKDCGLSTLKRMGVDRNLKNKSITPFDFASNKKDHLIDLDCSYSNEIDGHGSEPLFFTGHETSSYTKMEDQKEEDDLYLDYRKQQIKKEEHESDADEDEDIGYYNNQVFFEVELN